MQENIEKKAPRTRKTAAKAIETDKPVMKEGETAPAITFTEEQVRQMIADAVEKYAAENKPAPVSSNMNDGAVTMIFQAEVNDANEIQLGPNGKFGMITGKHATITIPKRDFIGEFRTTYIQYLLRTRNLIVVDGLTDDERRIYGLEYQQGEYLEPAVYERLIEMGDKVVDIFPKLHKTWREMVATKFIEAYENKTLKCSREALIELNRISKKDYADAPKEDIRRKGAFYSIIHAMNAADESEE